MGPHQSRFPERFVPEQLAGSSGSASGASSSSSSLGEGTFLLLCRSVDEHRTARRRRYQRTLESHAKVFTLAGTQWSCRTSTFPVMLRVASTDSVCAMKPDDHRMKILMPGDGILPKHRYSLPPVRFGRPFLDRYEALISLVRREQRLVFVRHFLTKLGCAVARMLRQKISNRAGAFAVLRYRS